MVTEFTDVCRVVTGGYFILSCAEMFILRKESKRMDRNNLASNLHVSDSSAYSSMQSAYHPCLFLNTIGPNWKEEKDSLLLHTAVFTTHLPVITFIRSKTFYLSKSLIRRVRKSQFSEIFLESTQVFRGFPAHPVNLV